MTSNTNNTVEFYWVEKDMLAEDNLVYVNRLFSAFKKECIGKDLKTLKIVIKCDFASGTSESKQTEDMGDAFRMILTLRDIEDRLREDAVEEEYVCCVGCGMSVCKFEEEPPHKDDRDEALCVECYGFHCEEEDTCKSCNESVGEKNICDRCNECCDPSRPSRCCECEDESFWKSDSCREFCQKMLIGYIEKAVAPIMRGKPTKRRCITLGKGYYWKGIPSGEDEADLEIWKKVFDLPDEVNTCLINVYEGGHEIGKHTDKKDGMNLDAKVHTISFGITEDLDTTEFGEELGYMKIDGVKRIITSGGLFQFDAYTDTHSARTKTSKKFKYRVNLTFRTRMG